MAQFYLRDFKKQASFFLRDRLNDARLALTDVSRIQLLAEEATNEDPWGPESKVMATLAEAAFELEEYERITHVIRNRLDGHKQRPWRPLYKTLVLLECLLIRGPVSIGKEFRGDILLFEELAECDFVDEHRVDRGSLVHKAADRVLELLNNTELWKEERIRARKLSCGIQGFGNSFNSLVDTQGGERSNDKAVPLSPKAPSKDEVNANGMSRIQSDGSLVSSQARQPKHVVHTKQQKVPPQSFKKSLSSLGHFKERLPYFSRQTFPDEDGTSDQEVSICLLDEEEDRDRLSRQVFQMRAIQRAGQLVTC